MAKKIQSTLKKAGSVKTTAGKPAKPTATMKMATKPAGTSGAQTEMMGLPQKTWVGTLRRPKGAEARSGQRGLLFIFGHRDRKLIKKALGAELSRWQQQMLDASEGDSVFFKPRADLFGFCRDQRPPSPRKQKTRARLVSRNLVTLAFATSQELSFRN